MHSWPHGYSFTAWPYNAVGTHPTGMHSCFHLFPYVIQSVERAFSLLKRRFHQLKILNQKSHERAVIVVMAACILHNISIFENDNIDYFLLGLGRSQQVNTLDN